MSISRYQIVEESIDWEDPQQGIVNGKTTDRFYTREEMQKAYSKGYNRGANYNGLNIKLRDKELFGDEE